LKCHVKKSKNVEGVVQVFTFVHFETANEHFRCKTITHMLCYTYNIILKLFIFDKNIMALLLCERQQNWLRVVTVVFRAIGIYVITATFFYVFYVFSKSKKSWFFTSFAVFRTFSRTMLLPYGYIYKASCARPG